MKIGRVLTVLPMLLASSVAWAQEVQVQIGGPPPPPPPPRVVVVAPPPPQYGPPPPYYGPRRYVPPPEGDINRPHFRWAFGVTGGPFIGDNFGGAGGIWGQAGVQLNALIGVVYQTHAMLGVVGSKSGAGACGGNPNCGFFGGIWFNEVMVDFTFGDVLQLGIGPSIDIFSVNSFADYFPGIDAKVGVALGRRVWGHRSGFMLGLDVHPTINTDQGYFPTSPVMTSILLTLGGGWW